MRKVKHFSTKQRKKAKQQYKDAIARNPVRHEESRFNLAGYLAKSLIENPPNWGSLDVKLTKFNHNK